MLSDLLTSKIQTLLGDDYKILSLAQLQVDYTTAQRYCDGVNDEYITRYTDEFTKTRQNKIVGIVTISNPVRANTDFYYITSGYSIDFSVPMNRQVRKLDGTVIEEGFDFFDDMETLAESIVNQKLTLGTKYCKMSISEPTYKGREKDGESDYYIFTISGNIAVSDKVNFGADYSIKVLCDDEYVELDNVNSFTEILNTDNDAIVKQDKTKVEQNLSQIGWACTCSIDDIQSTNEARLKLYEIIHENQEILNSNASTEASKRKLRVKITTPHGNTHLFDATVSITFNTDRNGVGSYDIAFTDDNKTISSYTLSFDSDGGSSVDSKTVKYLDEIGTLSSPTKTANTFAGWKIDTTSITANTVYNYTANKTATAQWENILKINQTTSGGRVAITITSEEDDVDIYYKVGGDTPTSADTHYSLGTTIVYTPIAQFEFKAIGYKNGAVYTDVVSATIG